MNHAGFMTSPELAAVQDKVEDVGPESRRGSGLSCRLRGAWRLFETAVRPFQKVPNNKDKKS